MRNVLLIEDEIGTGEELVRGISLQGFKVDWAKSGEEGAYMFFDKGGYDIVVSDLRLPGMDGLDVVSTLNNGELRPAIYLASSLPTIEMKLAEEQGIVRRTGNKRHVLDWLRSDYSNLRSMLIVEPEQEYGNPLAEYLKDKEIRLHDKVYRVGSAQAVTDPNEALDKLLNDKPGIIVTCPQLPKGFTGAELLGWAPRIVKDIEKAELGFRGAKDRGIEVTVDNVGDYFRVKGV